jgi:hypothetical protein
MFEQKVVTIGSHTADPQFQTLEALVEMIIPADDRSLGAKQARVADYIDLLLSESEPELTLQRIGALAALDAEARPASRRRSSSSPPLSPTPSPTTPAARSARCRARSKNFS